MKRGQAVLQLRELRFAEASPIRASMKEDEGPVFSIGLVSNGFAELIDHLKRRDRFADGGSLREVL